MSEGKANSQNCIRQHIWVDKDDAEWYKQTFGRELGYSKSIRLVMKSYRQGIEAQIAAKQPPGKRLAENERNAIVESALSGTGAPEGPGRDPED